MSPIGLPLELLWLAIGSAVAGGFAVLVATRLLSRHESGAAVREIVRAVEDLSEGRLDRLPAVEEDEPLAPVAAALAGVAETIRRSAVDRERQGAFLRALLDRARGIAFIGTDPSGDVTFWSDGGRELLGYTAEEVRGRPVSRLFTEASWELLSPRVSRREERESAEAPLSLVMRRREGGELPVIVSVSAGADREGRGLFLTVQDASRIAGVEKKLDEMEANHRRLIDGLRDGAFVLSRGGQFAYANRALGRLLGATGGELARHRLRDFVASEDILRVASLLAEVEAGSAAESLDCRLQPLDQNPPVEVRMTIAPAQMSGEPAVIGSVSEIGSSRRDWTRLRASEDSLDATLEATSDGILMVTGPEERLRVTVANQRLGEILGVDREELFRLVGPEVGERLRGGLKDTRRFTSFFEVACASAGSPVSELFETAGDDARVLEIFAAPARGRSGEVVGRVLSFRDVTGRQDLARSKEVLEKANEEIEKANVTLRQKSVELDRINKELRSLDQMKSALLANVSHELQTPLVSIKGYTEMILKGKLGSVTEEQKRGLGISLRNIDRLIAMIDNLLSLAHTEREMPAMEVATFPLWDLIEECIELVRRQADEKRITLTTRYLTEDLLVKGDRGKVCQVFVNLLSNGIKFNRDGGEVSISVRKGKTGYLIVEIRDTGIGIPSESLDRIFDRHYRVPESGGARREGSGLGLAIVRDILRLHGCVIKADSRTGEGSVFTFTLPMATAGGNGGPAGTAGGSDGMKTPVDPSVG